jgi:hypothetical protein
MPQTKIIVKNKLIVLQMTEISAQRFSFKVFSSNATNLLLVNLYANEAVSP